jgi:hypothetical protein
MSEKVLVAAEDNAILNQGDDYGKRSRQKKKDVKKKGKTLKEKRAAKREKKK